VLSDNFELRSAIKKIDTDFPPFALKNYYIMLSNKFYEKYPEFSEKFWDEQREIFNSEEYKEIVKKFYENN